MRFLPAKVLNGVRRAAILVSLLSTAGCNPYPSNNPGPLRITRVMVIDAALTQPAIVSEEDPGTDVVLDDVPLNYATIRIEFNRTLDGTTVQADPGGTDLCTPADNIAVTITPPNGVDPQATEVQVCYDPNGYAPAIVVAPSTSSCGGPIALGSLEPSFGYTISATGVRDHDGNSLDFAVTVNASPFRVVNVAVETGYDPEYGSTTSYAVLTPSPANAPIDVPTSVAGDGSVITSPTATQQLTASSYYAPSGLPVGVPHYVQPVLAPAAYYGPIIDATFSALMCKPGFEQLCLGDALLTVGGEEEPLGLLGSDYPISDPDDPTTYSKYPPPIRIVPLFPLEDDQLYTLSLGDNWTDANSGGAFLIGEIYTGYFRTAPGQGRVVWAAPAYARDDTGALPATEYLTLDPTMTSDWGSGRPGTGVALSAPIISGDFTLTPVPAAGVSVDFYPTDMRERTRFFTSTDLLPLEPDTDYALGATNVHLAGDPLPAIFNAAYEFHTYPFQNDPNFNGFVTSPQIVQEPAEPLGALTRPATIFYESPSGIVYAPMASGQVDTPYTVGDGRIAYLLAFTGRVLYASGTPSYSNGVFEYYPLEAPAGSTAPEVRMAELAVDGETEVGVVPGFGGYAKVASGHLDPWNARMYPGSLVGFVPSISLEQNTRYRVSVAVYPEGAAQATDRVLADLIFTTSLFRVTTIRRSDLTVLSPGSTDVLFDSSHPLTVRTTGLVDGDGFQAARTGQVIRLVESGETTREVQVTLALSGGGKYVTVTPAETILPATFYTLLVTSGLEAEDGTAIQTNTVSFSTIDDGTNCP